MHSGNMYFTADSVEEAKEIAKETMVSGKASLSEFSQYILYAEVPGFALSGRKVWNEALTPKRLSKAEALNARKGTNP
jgi:hypothetical protein